MSNFSDLEAARIVEFGEAEAFADIYTAAPPEFGYRVERIGSAFACVAPVLPMFFYNRVIGLGLNEPTIESMVKDIVRLYGEANIGAYGVPLGSIIQPPQLPEWLQSHHMLRRDEWPKVYRKPDANISVPTDLRIECIEHDHAADFAHVVIAAFEMPPFLNPWFMRLVGRAGWQHYMAFDGEIPVATGALFIKNKIGWLGFGATLASHRKRGAQGAIMAQRIRVAAEAGCDWVITETDEDSPQHPNPSYHNMLRTGFTLAYKRANYIHEAGG